MKTLIYTIVLLLILSLNAQKPLDTIYVNDNKQVALFFPKPIRQGITGAEHFTFTYNREKAQYFGLLQGIPKADSNLLVITGDGQIYAYILKYKDNIIKHNYFITESQSIGHENSLKTTNQVIKKETPKPKAQNLFKYQKLCHNLLQSKPHAMATKRKQGLKLSLLKKLYYKDQVYLLLEIKNNSEVDFEMDYLNIYITHGNNKRKASYQRLQQEVLHRAGFPNAIKTKQIKKFVYVLPKFVLGDNERLEIEVRELKGSRVLVLRQ